MTQAKKVTMAPVIDTNRLILEVQKRPPLWSQQILSGKETVDRLWGEVADSLGTKESQVKSKWKNLKDNFRKELKKVVEGGVGSNYVPMWPHYPKLLFLSDVILNSKRISYSSDEVSYATVGFHGDVDAKDEDDDAFTTYHGAAGDTRTSPKRWRGTEDDDTQGDHVYAEVHPKDNPRVAFNPTVEINPRHEIPSGANGWGCYSSDEDYHFFMSLIPHMKKFEPLQKLQIRNKIQEIIIVEMTKDSKNNPTTSSTETNN